MGTILTILLLVFFGVSVYMSAKKKKLHMKNLKAQNAFYNAGIKYFSAAVKTDKGDKNEKA